MSLTQNIQNLIDIINNTEHNEEAIQTAPKPQPSTADIDASEIKIVVLGCGLVVPPLIEYLNFYGYQLIIATRSIDKADRIVQRVSNPQLVRVQKLDVTASTADTDLDKLCQEGDVIISLLPYIYHVKAAHFALKYGKHFCTTSYISDAMTALHQQAQAKGLFFLNECGVDPGLDHMSAMKIIDDVRDNNGRIVSFTSLCGGLPAPEFNDNPFGYKFSWAPRGVLLASRNSATQLIDGQVVNVPGIDLFAPQSVRTEKVKIVGDLEWYYNRDSVKYIDIYGLKNISTMIRGTYRYPGWCATLKAIADLKLTSEEKISTKGKSYKQYFSQYLKISAAEPLSVGLSRLLKSTPENATAIKNLDWLGLFSYHLISADVPNSPIDVLCSLCLQQLKYAPNEKDMITMKHVFEVEYADGWRETRESAMLDFGLQPNDNSSMARTVTLPLAIAVRGLIEGRISKTRGVVRPLAKEIYQLVLSEIADLGIKFEEKTLTPLLWIRHEIKAGEKRVPITPEAAAKLLAAGYRVTVEKSKTRCIADGEYGNVGCRMVESGSWMADAPYSAFIVGLKELDDKQPLQLKHRHIFFAHAFKGQNEAVSLLRRFKAGKGEILDLEFLSDDKGRRVAAFGRSAGMVGMAMGIITWCKQVLHEKMSAMDSWPNEQAMIRYCVQLLERAVPKSKLKRAPKVIIIGALGRCGRGSAYIAKQCKLPEITEWDLAETKPGGPFKGVVFEHDIFVNCIRLMTKIPPFITMDMCRQKGRRMTVVSDVACDPNSPNNPVPIYTAITSMFEPVRRVLEASKGVPPLDITAIDHLPSLIPLEASQQYCEVLLPTLMELKNRSSSVWLRARKIFLDHVAKV